MAGFRIVRSSFVLLYFYQNFFSVSEQELSNVLVITRLRQSEGQYAVAQNNRSDYFLSALAHSYRIEFEEFRHKGW